MNNLIDELRDSVMKSQNKKTSDFDGLKAIEMLKDGEIVRMTYDHEGVVIKPEKPNDIGVRYTAITSRYRRERMSLLYSDEEMVQYVYRHFAINDDSMEYALKIKEKYPQIIK